MQAVNIITCTVQEATLYQKKFGVGSIFSPKSKPPFFYYYYKVIY